MIRNRKEIDSCKMRPALDNMQGVGIYYNYGCKSKVPDGERSMVNKWM